MKNQDYEQNIILDSIADGVFTVDNEFRITSLNRAGAEITGIDKDDAKGKLCYEIFHANICESSCSLRETMKTGKNIINKTIYIVNSGGERIPVSISTALLKNSKNEVIGGVETFRDISAIEALRKEIESKYTFEDMVSKNAQMRDLFSILPDIAQSDSTVLVEGQSGTGKELIARSIHNLSMRKKKPLIAVNCAAVPDNLIESELFGYKAGAFTDARRDKPGRIALAEGGTIFLDEIGELSPSIQAKLLRFLQEKEYEPLGSVSAVKANVRIISATNKNLFEEAGKGKFRDDLYYRLNVVNVKLPSLEERREDVPLLAAHFIKKYNAIKGKQVEGVSDDVMMILMDYRYPGNIRELENIIEHAFVLCKGGMIKREHLPVHLRGGNVKSETKMTLEEMEKTYIAAALEKYSGNKAKAAASLGINVSTLWRKMKKFGM